jgi:uncharacterized protein YdaU (DUF1376 family)
MTTFDKEFMHYFQFEIKEWISNTAHLTLEEEAIYLRLINYYYDSEAAFSEQDVEKILRKCRIKNTELAQEILKEFFFLEFGLWRHDRCDSEIRKYRAKSEQASRAGKASAEKRTNASLTPVQRPSNQSLIINQESLIKNHIKPIAPKVAIPIGVSEDLWKDFLTLRKSKKLPVTLTALKGISRESEKAKKSIAEVLQICCERGWGGFKAEWLMESPIKAGSPVVKQDWRNNDGLMLAKASELGLHTVGLQRFEIINKIDATIRSRGL